MYILTEAEVELTHKILTGPYAPSIENDLPGNELTALKELVQKLRTAIDTAPDQTLPEEPATVDAGLPTPPPTVDAGLPVPPPTPDNTLPTPPPEVDAGPPQPSGKPDQELPEHASPKNKHK